MNPFQNIKRDSLFIALKHCIQSCKDHRQLECLDEKVHKYAVDNKLEGKFLLMYYDLARKRLSVDCELLQKEYQLLNQ